MALTNVTFQLGPEVTVTAADGSTYLSPVTGASIQINPLVVNSTPTGTVDISQAGVLEFTLGIPAGATGSKGNDGTDGVGISSITTAQSSVTAGQPSSATLTFHMSNSTTQTSILTIPAGAQGNTGAPGSNGLSAYQIAVNGGYSGTESQWIASLKGAQGLSAYQIAVNGGYSGTQTQWIASLKGEKGDPGPVGPIADITDWTSQNAVNARSAAGYFARLDAGNSFSGTQTFYDRNNFAGLELGTNTNVAYIDFHSNGSAFNDFDVRIMSTGGSSGAIGQGTLNIQCAGLQWNGSQIATWGASNVFSTGQIISSSNSNNAVIWTDGWVCSLPSDINGHVLTTAIWAEQNKSSGSSYMVLQIAGTDASNNAYDHRFTFNDNGSINTPLGMVANCGVANTFGPTQGFNNNLVANDCAYFATRTSVNRKASYYVDTTGNMTIQLYDTSNNSATLSWFRLNSSGICNTSAGQLAFITDTPFYGQNRAQRIQAFVTSSTVAPGSVVSFPIAFTSVITVLIQPYSSNTTASYNNNNVANVTTTGFKYEGYDTIQLGVLAIGYY